MDTLNNYKKLIQNELQKFTKLKAANMPTIENQLIINKECTQFIVVSIGWHKAEYIHDWMFHIEIRDGKVWVHEDTTDFNIATSLIKKGIKSSDIVLGFVAPRERVNFELATA